MSETDSPYEQGYEQDSDSSTAELNASRRSHKSGCYISERRQSLVCSITTSTISTWCGKGSHLRHQHTLIELRKIREDRALARKRLGDMTPADRETCLTHVKIHLEKFFAKANRYKDMLHHMKGHYWARMHVCKAKMKILKRRLSRALKRRKRPDPLRILAEASLAGHDT